ncbi:hypothetical protein SH611_00560 [Geminicoccaceae bacterium 1502E]|nr:hypothetical protein [Geminicoccaceae bacterium 1502E]
MARFRSQTLLPVGLRRRRLCSLRLLLPILAGLAVAGPGAPASAGAETMLAVPPRKPVVWQGGAPPRRPAVLALAPAPKRPVSGLDLALGERQLTAEEESEPGRAARPRRPSRSSFEEPPAVRLAASFLQRRRAEESAEVGDGAGEGGLDGVLGILDVEEVVLRLITPF